MEELGLATGLATTAFLNSFGSDRVLGASAAQMLVGVGRPGLSSGLIEDVRDALESSLWYMRLEGGRYRSPPSPTSTRSFSNAKVRSARTRSRRCCERLSAVAPSTAELRVEPRVEDSADLPDNQQLVLGILDFGFVSGRCRRDPWYRT